MKKMAGLIFLALALALPLTAMAQVNVDINISLPPAIAFAQPPRLVVLPETDVYVAPEVDVDIFFYDGWWWRVWESRWYRSRSYSSGWIYYRYEPVFYRDVPREWRRWYRERRWREYTWEHSPIPFHEVERNWRDWEERRYWERERSWEVRGLRPSTRVDVDVRISSPPALVFAREPELVVIPETYVYVVPNLQIDVYFSDGWWWRSWEGRWYRSRNYSSGWVYYRSVPVFYRDIPRNWRQSYRERRWREYSWDHRALPYRQVQQHWQGWEAEGYWEKQKKWDMRIKKSKPQHKPQMKVKHRPSNQGGKSKHDNHSKGKSHKEKKKK